MIICDFCSSPQVKWRYPARSFQADTHCGSHGDWAACDICRELIESGDKTALLNWSRDTFFGKYPDLDCPELIAKYMSYTGLLHNQFFLNRKGEAVPV